MDDNTRHKVIVSGANGQLGQFLIKYLQENEPNICIIGTTRHKSFDFQPVIFDRKRVTFELMDLADPSSISNLISKHKPEYFINSAANAFVGESWMVPIQHIQYNTIGVLYMLDAIKNHSPKTRFFNMGTSEEFACFTNDGKSQNESTLIVPRSPYGCSKAAARHLVDVYRESFNLYALQGWTYNFESELRGEKYVTKKITRGVARISHSKKNDQTFDPIKLGNLSSVRSWQFAGDVADGVWRMLNQEKYNKDLLNVSDQDLPKKIKPYVLSSIGSNTVKEFIEKAFKVVDIRGLWVGNGLYEMFIDADNSDTLVSVDPKFLRPLDVTYLNGDSSAARADLGWKTTLTLDELVNRMVKWDVVHFHEET